MIAIAKSHRWVYFLFIVLLIGPHSNAQESPSAYSSLDDSHAALVIGDVKGLIDGAMGVVDLVMPGMSATIAAQIGGFLGDSELTGFEPGNGVAALTFPGNQVVVFAEVAENQRDAYQENTTNLGIKSAVVGDLLVFSQEESGIETGKKVADEVKEALLEGNGKASLEAYIHVPKILDTYKDEIDGGLKTFPEMMKASMAQSATTQPQSEGMVNILQAEVFVIYNLISQLDIFRLELTPGEDGISLEITFVPKKGN